MRFGKPSAALLIGAALFGCGGRESADAPTRFIEQPPVRAIAAADLRELGCDRRLHFADPESAASVELLEGARVEEVQGGLAVRGGLTAPRLAFRAADVPASVEAVRAVVRGVRRGKIRLSWSEAGGENPGELELDPSAGTGALRDHFLFDLAAAGAPAGRPLRLRLEPTTVAGEIVTIAEICLGRFQAGDDRLEAAAAVPWKVTVEADTRDALLFPAQGRISRSLELPAGARLELGLGRLLGAGLDTRLRVEAKSRGGAAVTVLDRPVTGAELDAGWLDLVVDLAGVPAGPTELSLILGLPGQPAPVIAASAPRVERPGRRDARPNIVLISIDTLRADHLSLYGYERETSPRLDAWARSRAIVFRRAVASATWTLPSHFSLFTGLDAFAHPANYNSLALDAAAYRFLAQELWRHGYRTQAYTGGVFVTPDYGLANGFEGFAYWGWKARRDEELEAHLAEVGRFLDGAPAEPFFLFLHTYEVHTPNKSREPWYTRWAGAPLDGTVDLTRAAPSGAEGFLGTGRFVLRPTGHPADPQDVTGTPVPGDAYDSAVAYVDEKLTPLLERLSEPPWGENTVIAVVSDHGESLLDERRAGHTFPSLDNLMIPMILRLPGDRRPVTEVGAQVRLHDLYPTLLELAGVPVEGEIGGRSLLPMVEGRERRGRPAMAYVAPTNWGLVLLTPDGYKVEWRNSPWRPIAGQRLWFAVDGFRESPLEVAPPEAGRYFEGLRRAYAERAVGLALDLSAVAGPPVEVEVVTDLVDPVSTKAPDPEMPGIDWLDVGRLRASVGPGRPLRLRFEQTVRREIGVVVRARFPGCPQPIEVAVAGPIEEFRQARRWQLTPDPGAGCDPEAAPGSGLTLELGWRGPVPTTETEVDEELREELRALGYLN